MPIGIELAMDAANETAGVYSKIVGDKPVIMNEGARIAVEDVPHLQ